ncbi:MAG: glycosyl transferase family protein [Rhodospirillaceae bacterium]|jgi:anthranilate phosphoribosyltransferase|nr:glycosyl transferase family protein [Rhodospirillaceae bacterium]
MTEEHPFAPYVRILARGKTKTRSLTEEEAEGAMTMILAGEVRPEQLGAFLMLLRLKEETADEIAGFVKAVRATFKVPASAPQVDLDWSSYAGKRRQLPWFLLSALLLAQNGTKVFMHGTEGHTPGRVYLRDTLKALGLPVAGSFDEATAQLEGEGFAYLPLECLSQTLRDIIDLKPILGLRSPVHTVARLLNPFGAPNVLQGIFHRGFMETHQVAAKMLGFNSVAVFRGEGGEIERRPNKETEVCTLHEGELGQEWWPQILDQSFQAADEDMDIDRLARVWRGDEENEYGVAAVIGTLAIALRLIDKSLAQDKATEQAQTLWQERDLTKFN